MLLDRGHLTHETACKSGELSSKGKKAYLDVEDLGALAVAREAKDALDHCDSDWKVG